ncbi:leucine-rich repeat protein 1-like isoform X2 [Durio zibethinus]|uniref:Leucine-rich repeat protein 1-like isoform X2 n=1 Tax=Durio zibethinus TaxID=66656 RepID=A0A6P5YG98_DURZI|nr:leucine-rich repeat protein 1-like isoform X2 [Durio zibethinus]
MVRTKTEDQKRSHLFFFPVFLPHNQDIRESKKKVLRSKTKFLLYQGPFYFSFMGLLILLLLTCAALPLASSDPNDEACLTHLSQTLKDPLKNLQNWTKSIFANPCNGFTSYLPGATCNNGRIYKLSLTNLSLQGSLSPFLSNCTNLQSLDLSSNSISGPIPQDLQYLVNLAVLNLSSNRLEEEIPPQLTLCAYLNVIDLHDNLLTGPIPASLGNRSGNLPRFNASSFQGNKDLYGYPLPPMKSKGLSILAIVGIGLGSGLASLVLSFTGVCIWLKITEERMAAEEGKISQLMPDY